LVHVVFEDNTREILGGEEEEEGRDRLESVELFEALKCQVRQNMRLGVAQVWHFHCQGTVGPEWVMNGTDFE
jgi:hypothetical protein